MNEIADFFRGKFAQDLKNGKLPPVEVEFSTASLIQVSVTIIIASIIVILAGQIVKKLV